MPLDPKPPGMSIALYFLRILVTFFLLIFVESTHSVFKSTSLDRDPCIKASSKDLYASFKSTYLPTIAIEILFLFDFILLTMSFHIFKFGLFFSLSLNIFKIFLSNFSSLYLIGTS